MSTTLSTRAIEAAFAKAPPTAPGAVGCGEYRSTTSVSSLVPDKPLLDQLSSLDLTILAHGHSLYLAGSDEVQARTFVLIRGSLREVYGAPVDSTSDFLPPFEPNKK